MANWDIERERSLIAQQVHRAPAPDLSPVETALKNQELELQESLKLIASLGERLRKVLPAPEGKLPNEAVPTPPACELASRINSLAAINADLNASIRWMLNALEL